MDPLKIEQLLTEKSQPLIIETPLLKKSYAGSLFFSLSLRRPYGKQRSTIFTKEARDYKIHSLPPLLSEFEDIINLREFTTQKTLSSKLSKISNADSTKLVKLITETTVEKPSLNEEELHLVASLRDLVRVFDSIRSENQTLKRLQRTQKKISTEKLPFFPYQEFYLPNLHLTLSHSNSRRRRWWVEASINPDSPSQPSLPIFLCNIVGGPVKRVSFNTLIREVSNSEIGG